VVSKKNFIKAGHASVHFTLNWFLKNAVVKRTLC